MNLDHWHGLAYEFSHTFFSRTILLVIVIGALLALIASAEVSASTPSPARMYSGILYFSDGQYHFDFFAFNEYGSPLEYVPFVVQVYSGSSTVANLEGETGSNGTADLSASLASSSYTANFHAGPNASGQLDYWSRGLSEGGAVSIGPMSAGQFVTLSSPFAQAIDLPTGFTGHPGVVVYLPVLKAACGSPCGLYYRVINSSGGYIGPIPERSMTLVGPLSLVPEEFSLTVATTKNIDSDVVVIEAFTSSGTLIAEDANTSATSLTSYASVTSVSNQAYAYYTGEVTYALPLLSIVAAYSVYARDRLSGVLESTIVQPVTRQAVVLSRYTATLCGLLTAVGVGMLIADLTIHAVLGYFVYPAMLVSFLFGFLITIAFFVGLVFLLSHTLRSTGALLGIVFAVFAVLSIFWVSVGGSLQSYFNVPLAGYSSDVFEAKLDLFNPIQYSSIMLAEFANVAPAISGYGGSGKLLAQHGVTLPLVVIASLLWTVGPLVVLLWRVRSAD